MKTITKEFKVYNYNELSDDAKQNVKQWYLDGQDSQFFTRDIIENLNEIGLNNLKTYYSLSYCQGDGLCLYGKIYLEEIDNNKDLKSIFYNGFTISDYKALSIIKESEDTIYFKHSGNYYYSSSVDIDLYVDGSLSVKMYNLCEKTKEKLLLNVQNWYNKQCKEFAEYGYNYFYEISDEDLNEICECNEYEFLEDGSIF